MLNKRDGGKRAAKVKDLIWNTNKKDWKKTKSKTWRWWKEVSKKGNKSRRKDDPGNERREEKEQEETQDYEWRRRGKCLLCLSACVCVCVRRGCSLLTPCVTTGRALGKYKHPGRSDGDGESRERQRRERWRKRGQPQVCTAADVYLCVSVCASVGLRVSSLCFSVLAAVHLCHTSAIKSNRQLWRRKLTQDLTKTYLLQLHTAHCIKQEWSEDLTGFE